MILQRIDEIIALEPRKLFQIDGFGAILSAILYVVLAYLEDVIGMPSDVLFYLGGLALMYATYSMSCYLIKMKNWQPYLKVIAGANLLHCFLTVGLVIHYNQDISFWGLLYFIGEIIIVVALAIFEFKVASNDRYSTSRTGSK